MISRKARGRVLSLSLSLSLSWYFLFSSSLLCSSFFLGFSLQKQNPIARRLPEPRGNTGVPSLTRGRGWDMFCAPLHARGGQPTVTWRVGSLKNSKIETRGSISINVNCALPWPNPSAHLKIHVQTMTHIWSTSKFNMIGLVSR